MHGEGRGAVRRRRRRETKRGRRDGENGGGGGGGDRSAYVTRADNDVQRRGGAGEALVMRRREAVRPTRYSRRQTIPGHRQATRPRVRRGRRACGAKKLRRQARDDNERRWQSRSETKLTTDEPRDRLVDPPHRTARPDGDRPTRPPAVVSAGETTEPTRASKGGRGKTRDNRNRWRCKRKMTRKRATGHAQW